LFYPGRPNSLRTELGELLDPAGSVPAGRAPKLLIVPHAGYVYSGPVAAAAYGRLRGIARSVRRVVLLGPTHRVAVRGVAIPTASAFATPLGDVQLDLETLQRLAAMPHVVTSDAAHASEHSLEVQLPFLQTVLADFRLVPLAVGSIAGDDLANVLDTIWGGDETLIVVSSDLSHYHPYAEAKALDRSTVERILALATGIDHEHACGATPINAALALARRRGLQPQLLAMSNSGDTAGDRSRVVGYCAIAFTESADAPR
jgi:AmmeMemoRadiSam system protein B